ncbi:MAG: hypothetical protein ABIH59_03500 [archaeon]
MTSLSKRILLGITGKNPQQLQNKIAEAEKLKIKRIAIFLEFLNKIQRKKIYSTLLSSKIKKIPFVHARHDMSLEELQFLKKQFKTKYFNIHEEDFKQIKNWKDFQKKILIEFNYDNKIPNYINMEKTGGFCVDLSHFKSAEERWTSEFEYIFLRKKHKDWFIANHLNGYSKTHRKDLHTIKSLKEFNYLKTLPKFIFGKYIALETFNSLKEQLKFKKYIIKILKTNSNLLS